VVPAAVLQGDGEDVHDGMVQRLAAGLRVHLLRVVRPGPDHVVGVVGGVDGDLLDRVEVRIFSRIRKARSISAWDWYSAECSLV
jgi:hypothetical protein